MSKFEIRNPILITAALALTPALAFAGDAKHSSTTTTTTTTTSAQGSATTTSAQGSAKDARANHDASGVMSPSPPPDMRESDATRVNTNAKAGQAAIDPAQVQKVFGVDTALIDLKVLDKDQVKQLQQRLQERGFYRGKVDGAMGPQTRKAITGLMAQQYALNQRLVNQGQLTEQFASSLGVGMNGRMPVTGVDSSDQARQQPARAQGTTPTQPHQ